jgi:hypothetical protein
MGTVCHSLQVNPSPRQIGARIEIEDVDYGYLKNG